MIQFKQKEYSSLKEDLIPGIIMGSGIGGGIGKIFGKKTTAYGAIIGAALGALSATLRWTGRKISRKKDGVRLSTQISNGLNGLGFKENLDFTLDPKMANLLKTKVCIVFSRSKAEFKIILNSLNDSKLSEIIKSVVKSYPKSGYPVITEKNTDKFNEIQIVSIPSEDDISIILDSIGVIIEKGYPVYIVEVG